MSKPVQKGLSQSFEYLRISSIFEGFFVTFLIKIPVYFPILVAFLETWAVLPTLSSFFLYYSPAQLILLFLKHLYRNWSAAYQWLCSDVYFACKQQKADEFLQEIKELVYVGKGVHWRRSSCSRVFWTLICHLPLHKHGIMAAVFHSHQRLHSFPNCCQSSAVRPLAYTCAV